MSLELRVEKLERSLRRSRLTATWLAGLVVVGVFVGADVPKQAKLKEAANLLKGDAGFENIFAKRLVLVDDEGNAFLSALRDSKTGDAIFTVGNEKTWTTIIGGKPIYAGHDDNGKPWKITPQVSAP